MEKETPKESENLMREIKRSNKKKRQKQNAIHMKLLEWADIAEYWKKKIKADGKSLKL